MAWKFVNRNVAGVSLQRDLRVWVSVSSNLKKQAKTGENGKEI